jgi:hypothetical protein
MSMPRSEPSIRKILALALYHMARLNKEGASFHASAVWYAACHCGGNELDSHLGQTRATAQARKSGHELPRRRESPDRSVQEAVL